MAGNVIIKWIIHTKKVEVLLQQIVAIKNKSNSDKAESKLGNMEAWR